MNPSTKCTFSIFDIQGIIRIIYAALNLNKDCISFNNLVSGMYFLRVELPGGRMITKSFIKR